MYQLSDRCEMLRRLVTSKNDYEDYFCLQHRVYFTLGALEAKNKQSSNMDIVSSGLVNLLNKLTPVIIYRLLILAGYGLDSWFLATWASPRLSA